ncbi:DMT family transporter [Desulforhopalus sp. IMCC35007]|uniref:DMT family transporter n=1 Tax=Desulforhopalus sp. IMCC35007 TaxID=2569543 RepID=UPI0010AE8682|nr:DMT family transporter [Desulforhopalus sp. IMCC35007]TKB11808.1 DMT family transporter [Desulforhopalus sp. IMCC35007]
MNTQLFTIIVATGFALVAFAANSVLCRLALGNGAIDPAAFTVLRLLSGGLVLFIISGCLRPGKVSSRGSWSGGSMLFLYASSFSYAYVSLDTGTGALILFGAVQITMIGVALMTGTRLRTTEWLGLILAFIGLVYLILPGVTTPTAIGFGLMALAGMAWGIYTLQGRNSQNPLSDTAYNFIRTIPFVVLLTLFSIKGMYHTPAGIGLALLSGGITSAIGYTIWYMALGNLSAIQAGVLQLSVPVIAALGGVVFVGEAITLRLAISAAMVLGGILIVILGRYSLASR